MAVHAIHGLELRKLLETRPAPGGPEIHQENLARGVLAQPLQVLGDGGLYRDRSPLDLGDGLQARLLLVHPFGRTPDSGRLHHRHRFAGQQGVEGLAGVAPCHIGLARIVVDAALVAQLALGIEDEKVRRGAGSVGARHFLRVAVVEIGKIEMPELGADFLSKPELLVDRRIQGEVAGSSEIVAPHRADIGGRELVRALAGEEHGPP